MEVSTQAGIQRISVAALALICVFCSGPCLAVDGAEQSLSVTDVRGVCYARGETLQELRRVVIDDTLDERQSIFCELGGSVTAVGRKNNRPVTYQEYWQALPNASAPQGRDLKGVPGGRLTEDGSGGMNKTTSGALIGAGAGASLGGLFSHGSAGAIVAGGLAGGLLGGVIGHEMDERDRAAHDAALQQALQTSMNNQIRHWQNPKTGNSGTINPLDGYTRSAAAQTCRRFSEIYAKDGKTYEQTSRACRDKNGEWQLADN